MRFVDAVGHAIAQLERTCKSLNTLDPRMHVGRSMSDEKKAPNDAQGNAGGSTYHVSLQMGDMEPRLANTVIALTGTFQPGLQSRECV